MADRDIPAEIEAAVSQVRAGDWTYAMVHPTTLAVTHIFDGEEVVTGGGDGQIWIATFASAGTAEQFINAMRDRAMHVRGMRRVKREGKSDG